MGIAVKVVVVENSVSPAVRPAIRGKARLEIAREMIRGPQRQPIHDERKLGVIWNPTVILEPAKLG
jgi:hypothetical protein